MAYKYIGDKFLGPQLKETKLRGVEYDNHNHGKEEVLLYKIIIRKKFKLYY
jgi:hypothetical protein